MNSGRESQRAKAAPSAPGDLTPRGTQRRVALMEAALRIIVRDGPGAVTLRSVVAEAKASHGSVAYYFGSREDLVRETLIHIADRNIKALEEAWVDIEKNATDPATVAAMIARHSTRRMVEDRGMGITIIELHLASARCEALRPALREWGRAYTQIASKTLLRLGSKRPEADAALLVGIVNGHVVSQLALPKKNFEHDVLRPSLEEFLSAIQAKPKK